MGMPPKKPVLQPASTAEEREQAKAQERVLVATGYYDSDNEGGPNPGRGSLDMSNTGWGETSTAGFNDNQKRLLLDGIGDLDTAECEKAFKAAGATPVADQVADGITFVSMNIARRSNDDKRWAPDNALAQSMRNALVFNATAEDITYVGPYKGKRYSALADSAFKETNDFFLVILVHVFIHSGGKPGRNYHYTGRDHPESKKDGIFGPIYARSTRHDLEWMGESYNRIIRDCTGLESQVGLARGKPLPAKWRK